MNDSEQIYFDALYQKHLTALRLQGKATKTVDSYGRAVRRLAHNLDCCPDALTVDQLTTYFADLSRSHSWSTVKIDRNGIAFFHRHVLKRDMPWIEMVKPPVVHSLPDILTCEEIARIIAATREMRYRTFWFVTYSMGLRLGETLNLRIGDIDSTRMCVHVRLGKGKRDRFVLLPDIALRALRRLWTTHRDRCFLFPARAPVGSNEAGRCMDRSNTQRAFARVVHDCRIQKKVSIHSLRHSYATRLVETGLNLRCVQALLGHTSPQTTARYVHITEANLHNQALSVNNLANELAAKLRQHGERS